LGASFEGQRCVSSLEKEDEVSGFWCLEDDPIDYLVVYLEGKEPKDFLRQRFILARFEALLFEDFV